MPGQHLLNLTTTLRFWAMTQKKPSRKVTVFAPLPSVLAIKQTCFLNSAMQEVGKRQKGVAASCITMMGKRKIPTSRKQQHLLHTLHVAKERKNRKKSWVPRQAWVSMLMTNVSPSLGCCWCYALCAVARYDILHAILTFARCYIPIHHDV